MKSVIILIVALIFISFAFNNSLSLQEIMEIVKKSPDYNDFLSAIKMEEFDSLIVDYHKYSNVDYDKADINLQKSLDNIKISKYTYIVELKSITDNNKGLLAVIDIKNKEPKLLVALLEIKVKI